MSTGGNGLVERAKQLLKWVSRRCTKDHALLSTAIEFAGLVVAVVSASAAVKKYERATAPASKVHGGQEEPVVLIVPVMDGEPGRRPASPSVSTEREPPVVVIEVSRGVDTGVTFMGTIDPGRIDSVRVREYPAPSPSALSDWGDVEVILQGRGQMARLSSEIRRPAALLEHVKRVVGPGYDVFFEYSQAAIGTVEVASKDGNSQQAELVHVRLRVLPKK